MPLDCFTFCPNWSRMTLACGSFWAKAGNEIRAINNINKYLSCSIWLILSFYIKSYPLDKNSQLLFNEQSNGYRSNFKGLFYCVIGFVENHIAQYPFYKALPLACCLGLAQRYLPTPIDPLSALPYYNLVSYGVVLRK